MQNQIENWAAKIRFHFNFVPLEEKKGAQPDDYAASPDLVLFFSDGFLQNGIRKFFVANDSVPSYSA